jgi:hypothetical protein
MLDALTLSSERLPDSVEVAGLFEDIVPRSELQPAKVAAMQTMKTGVVGTKVLFI